MHLLLAWRISNLLYELLFFKSKLWKNMNLLHHILSWAHEGWSRWKRIANSKQLVGSSNSQRRLLLWLLLTHIDQFSPVRSGSRKPESNSGRYPWCVQPSRQRKGGKQRTERSYGDAITLVKENRKRKLLQWRSQSSDDGYVTEINAAHANSQTIYCTYYCRPTRSSAHTRRIDELNYWEQPSRLCDADS